MGTGTAPKTGSRCAARAMPGARATGIAASSAAAALACGPAMETRAATPPRQPRTAMRTGKSRSETSRHSPALSASSGRPRYFDFAPFRGFRVHPGPPASFLGGPGMSAGVDACPGPFLKTMSLHVSFTSLHALYFLIDSITPPVFYSSFSSCLGR